MIAFSRLQRHCRLPQFPATHAIRQPKRCVPSGSVGVFGGGQCRLLSCGRADLGPAMPNDVLAHLVGPMSSSQFMSTTHDCDWLLTPHSSDPDSSDIVEWVRELLRPEDLPGLLRHQADISSNANVRLSLDMAGYTPGAMANAASFTSAMSAVSAGHSIALAGLESFPGALAEVSLRLSNQLGHLVRASCHFMVPGSVAAEHPAEPKPWGTVRTGTFVLQTAGMSCWKLPQGRHVAGGSAVSETMDITLRPGDVLYIPAGLAHDAGASLDEFSMHLTLRLDQQSLSWASLVALVCHRVEQGAVAKDNSTGLFYSEFYLEEAMLQEAAHIEGLYHARMPAAVQGVGAASAYLPAVLQYCSRIPEDLPPGVIDLLQQRLSRFLKRLCRVGHLHRTVTLHNGDEALLNDVVSKAMQSSPDQQSDALRWALAQLREKAASQRRFLLLPAGDTFTSAARLVAAGSNLEKLTFQRNPWERPFIQQRDQESEATLVLSGRQHRIDGSILEEVKWCLGHWCGAAGLSFGLSRIPSRDSSGREGAVRFLVGCGALVVFPQ
eukprot:TRINITY_DN27912_c0_g2_i1.p1 TRINITY_DN27912_c0_g2~~TRINITY_DN27912_c0_g2_i1.p1  ORF type:complete len:551 (-),score=65.84 TRINITY_DN27912_c0_g2_i1:135-1787(-)